MEEKLDSLVTREIVVDTDSRFSYIGTLKGFDDHFLELNQVAIYDEAIIKVSLEEFLVECHKNGTPVSRGKTLVNRNRIIALSAVDEIVMV